MRYQANPVVVDAYEIYVITFELGKDYAVVTLRDGGNVVIDLPVRATKEMMARMTPKPGDYWVVQSDGYTYLNPKDVFERKYSPLPITEALPSVLADKP